MQAIKFNPKNKLRNGIAFSILPQFLIVRLLAANPEWIEQFYSKGFYPYISRFFRNLFGWIPFSVGEILYTTLIILSFRYLIRNRKKIKTQTLSFVRDCAMVLAVFYFTFNMVWGLNYHRKPLGETLEIVQTANYEEIKKLTEELVIKTNTLQVQITGDTTKMVEIPYDREEIFEKIIDGYDSLDDEIPLLNYQNPNLKKSIYSSMSSYMGIGGYLNPFTNEAQVNQKIPVFRFPVVVAHEIGHQIGYAAENETNLIGYLVTHKNDDIYFQYAASAYALAYCLNAVHRTDEEAFNTLRTQLNAGLLKNYKELSDFNAAYENPFEPIFQSIFNGFLKANNQTDGVKSYSKVVHLLVGYHKKHPL